MSANLILAIFAGYLFFTALYFWAEETLEKASGKRDPKDLADEWVNSLGKPTASDRTGDVVEPPRKSRNEPLSNRSPSPATKGAG